MFSLFLSVAGEQVRKVLKGSQADDKEVNELFPCLWLKLYLILAPDAVVPSFLQGHKKSPTMMMGRSQSG